MGISTFATQALTYDVQNQTGTNPVWVRIRLVGGTTYQFVPAPYTAGVWNTVNAATGQWQLMDINGNGTGPMMTLAEVATANPGAMVDRVYLTMGIGDSYNVSPGVGTVAWVDKVTIDTVIYDFVVATPTDWYVATTGLDTNEGTEISPFLTIQHAVNSAGTGDTIHVAAGTYDEQVVIDNKNLTLLGAGDTTIIRPSAPTTLTSLYTYPAGTFWAGTVNSSVILVKNTGAAVVKDLKIDGVNLTTLPAGASRLAGILYGESAGIIDNVTVTTMVVNGYATRSYGIDLSAVGTARTVEVKNSDITDWSRNGIQAQGASLTANIHDNILVGPGDTLVPAAVPNGILFIHGVNGYVTHNTISALHTSVTPSRSAGILFYNPVTAGIVVEYNNISDVDDGVTVSANANDVIIRFNNLHANLEVGIQLEDGATNTIITGNTITGNVIAGIRFAGATDPTFPDNPPGTGNVAHGNSITGNGIGIVDYDTQIFNAENNWWGAVSGPGPVGIGSGEEVSTNVDYSPWCTNAACTTFAPPFDTLTTITADTPDPSLLNQTVSVTATVEGLPAGALTPTGTVTISGGVADCTINLVGGTGSCDITFNTGGAKTITATYNPDTADFTGSSDTESHNITLVFTTTSQGANDGLVVELSEDSSVGGSLDLNSITSVVGDYAGDLQVRSILSFDTSALPDDAVITKITLKIRRQSVVGTDPFTILGNLLVDMRKPFFSGNLGLVIADFQAAANRTAVGIFRCDANQQLVQRALRNHRVPGCQPDRHHPVPPALRNWR